MPKVVCFLVSALVLTNAISLTRIPADSSNVLLQGRYAPFTNGSILVDIEGASASITIANATFVGALVSDTSMGGARLGSFINTNVATTPLDPNPSANAMPNLRVGTFLTSPLQSLYTMGSGGQINGLVATYTLQLLSEWEMIADAGGINVLAFDGFVTDGVVLAAPTRPQRRIIVLGDSLSSGVGAGFDVPASGAACGAGVAEDDVGPTYGMRLCGNFSAECEIVAGSGITITRANYNLPLVFPWSLGAMAQGTWPAAQRVPWDLRSHVPDVVVMELGENDCHTFNCTNPANIAKLANAYVSFVHNITAAYGTPNLPVFLTIAMHEAGQSTAMIAAAKTLSGEGFRVQFLNATVPNVLPDGTVVAIGCGGHPSAQAHGLAFERAQPVISKVLGW